MIFSSTVKLPANPFPAFEADLLPHVQALRPGIERVLAIGRETAPFGKLNVRARVAALRHAAIRSDETPEELAAKIALMEHSAAEALPLLARRQKNVFFDHIAPGCQTIVEIAEKILPEIRSKAAQVDKELARAYSLPGCTLVSVRANALAADLEAFRVVLAATTDQAALNNVQVSALLDNPLLRPLAKALGRLEKKEEPSVPVVPATPSQPPQVAVDDDNFSERAV